MDCSWYALLWNPPDLSVLYKRFEHSIDQTCRGEWARWQGDEIICCYFTGLSRKEFNIVYNLLEDGLMDQARSRSLVDPKHKCSPRELLAITLGYLRDYLTDDVIGRMFDLGRSSVSRHCHSILKMMSGHSFMKATIPEMKSIRSGFGKGLFKGAIVAVDTTDIRIELSRDSEDYPLFLSPKKGVGPAVKVLVAVGLKTGLTCFVSSCERGAEADATMVRRYGFEDQLREMNAMALGNGGFKGFEWIYSPRIKPAHGELSKEDKDYNDKLGSYRAIVENFFDRLKEWRVCGTRIRGIAPYELDNLTLIVRACISLTNIQLGTHPLRR
jgi:hypothetical protein